MIFKPAKCESVLHTEGSMFRQYTRNTSEILSELTISKQYSEVVTRFRFCLSETLRKFIFNHDFFLSVCLDSVTCDNSRTESRRKVFLIPKYLYVQCGKFGNYKNSRCCINSILIEKILFCRE